MANPLSDATPHADHRIFPPVPSSESLASNMTRVSNLNASRISLLPYLRRLEVATANQPSSPLLTLSLSSTSYLDSHVYADLSLHPMYTITTQGASTVVLRFDAWDTSVKIADIKWPKPSSKTKDQSAVLVQVNADRWKSAATLLRSGSFASSSRKFNIPGCSRSLKWKQVGQAYWCITSSTKGPIAVLEPAAGAVPPRIKVYESLRDRFDTHPLTIHRGVSILLLDYLLVTSLFLVTGVQEWITARKLAIDANSATTLSSPSSQWRKFIFGEPLFQRRSSTPAITLSCSQLSPPASAPALQGIHPYSAPFRGQSSEIVLDIRARHSESDDEGSESDIEEILHQPPSRAPSPSAESLIFFPVNSSAPSHTYLDPSFYDAPDDVPPVPPIPSQYAKDVPIIASSPNSATSRSIRSLPQPPPSSFSRSRSLTSPSPSTSSQRSTSVSRARESQRPSRPVVRTHSLSSRQLPIPPTPTTPGSSIRDTLSPLHSSREKSVSGRSLPPTPLSAPAHSNSDPLLNRPPKDSHEELLEWTGSRDHTVFEQPPPAYNSVVRTAINDLPFPRDSEQPPSSVQT